MAGKRAVADHFWIAQIQQSNAEPTAESVFDDLTHDTLMDKQWLK